MYQITLVCTRHKESENCNSYELHNIIEILRPEIIFEELSNANFHQFHVQKIRSNLETNAIKMYLQNHPADHIPVDTYFFPISYEDDCDHMYERLFNNNSTESFMLRRLIDKQSTLEEQYGFKFMNNDENDRLILEIQILIEKILQILNDKDLFRIRGLEKKVIAKRERAMLDNIYHYSKEHSYQQGLFLIGSGHRSSIRRLITEYVSTGEIKLNWTYFS
jgi:hypothetical protein